MYGDNHFGETKQETFDKKYFAKNSKRVLRPPTATQTSFRDERYKARIAELERELNNVNQQAINDRNRYYAALRDKEEAVDRAKRDTQEAISTLERRATGLTEQLERSMKEAEALRKSVKELESVCVDKSDIPFTRDDVDIACPVCMEVWSEETQPIMNVICGHVICKDCVGDPPRLRFCPACRNEEMYYTVECKALRDLGQKVNDLLNKAGLKE